MLVVSRNPAVAMGFSATDHDVVDLRPRAFGAWIDGDEDADALVLDLQSPQLSAAAVNNLRTHGKVVPVLLVSSDVPGWSEPDMNDLPGAQVVPLPINRAVLIAALEQLLAGERATAETAPEAPFLTPLEEEVTGQDVAFRTAEALDALDRDALEAPSDEVDELDAFVVRAQIARSAVERDLPQEARAGSEAGLASAIPRPTDAVPISPTRPATKHRRRKRSDGDQLRERERPAPPPLTAVPRTRRTASLPVPGGASLLDEMDRLRGPANAPPAELESAAASPPADPVELVRTLSRAVHLLYGVPETAEVVITDAVDRTRADAGALLVPDDGDWRVAAGVELRALEHRYELHADSWLVQEIATGHKGVVVEESDIARERLQGAPLASWRHLLAAPVPQVEALLILARREDPPFDEQDLAILATLGAEAGPLLSAAVDTRSLARSLWEFRDEVELPR